MKLTHILHLEGDLVVRTGLHIGAGKNDIRIGGVDNSVQRDPGTGRPVIPGSSLKGKLRTLTEWRHGLSGSDGGPFDGKGVAVVPGSPGWQVIQIFGTAADVPQEQGSGPSRLKVADAIQKDGGRDDCFEEKTEIAINRLKGTTDAGLRTFERVIAGTRFQLDISFRCFQSEAQTTQQELKLFEQVLQGLELVALDGLGGSSSRGYGRVGFANLALWARTFGDDRVAKEDWSEAEPWQTLLKRLHEAGVNA